MVDILLAVYNGGEYLQKQLDSLLSQTLDDICIIIGDDGSSDGSRDVLKSYEKEYPQKIRLYLNEKNIGVKANFFKLLEMSKAEYIMFCDQDDIWDSGKAETTLIFLNKTNTAGLCLPIRICVLSTAAII